MSESVTITEREDTAIGVMVRAIQYHFYGNKPLDRAALISALHVLERWVEFGGEGS